MKQYSFTDDDLRLAAASVCASMVEAAEAIPGGEHEFSESFLEKMDSLVALDKRRSKRRRVWHRVASVFLAFLLGASIFLATNPEARAAFLAWVREVYENSVVYRFFGRPAEDFPQYELNWIPEGFVLESEINDEYNGNKQIIMTYENPETGESFSFCYQSISEDISMVVGGYEDEDAPSPEHCTINGLDGEYYPPGASGTSSLVWMDERKGVVLYIDSNLEKSVVLHIADGVRLVNPTR